MNNPQPLDAADKASVDGLETIFLSKLLSNDDTQVEKLPDTQAAQILVKEETPKPAEPASEELQVPWVNIDGKRNNEDSEQLEIDNTRIARSDLLTILESFVNTVRASDTPAHQIAADLSISALSVDDKTSEIEDMRKLLLEAQETIINLLTDRVNDRAKIATLEAELKLLPDLQAQADRTIAVAMNTADFRQELTKIKYELERFRLARVRHEIDTIKRSWWTGVRGWLWKRPEDTR